MVSSNRTRHCSLSRVSRPTVERILTIRDLTEAQGADPGGGLLASAIKVEAGIQEDKKEGRMIKSGEGWMIETQTSQEAIIGATRRTDLIETTQVGIPSLLDQVKV